MKTFRAIANVIDVTTNIEIKQFSEKITCRCVQVARRQVCKKAESYALGLAKKAAQERYNLTAKQLDLMVEDGLICAYNSYAIEVECYELNPSWSHPYVQEVLADSLY